MMNKYVVMSLVAIAIITAQVAVAMTQAKTEINTLISNKNKVGLRALVAYKYFDFKIADGRGGASSDDVDNAYKALWAAGDFAHDARKAISAAAKEAYDGAGFNPYNRYAAADNAYKQLMQYILKGVVPAGITLDPIDGLDPQCIAKALEQNVPLYPRIDCSKLK
jgi:hypothetical protein